MPRPPVKGEDTYVVRLFDGFNHQWIDVSEPMCYEWAQAVWNRKTNDGTKNTNFDDIDYYDIFPASVSMMFSNGFGERGHITEDDFKKL